MFSKLTHSSFFIFCCWVHPLSFYFDYSIFCSNISILFFLISSRRFFLISSISLLRLPMFLFILRMFVIAVKYFYGCCFKILVRSFYDISHLGVDMFSCLFYNLPGFLNDEWFFYWNWDISKILFVFLDLGIQVQLCYGLLVYPSSE